MREFLRGTQFAKVSHEFGDDLPARASDIWFSNWRERRDKAEIRNRITAITKKEKTMDRGKILYRLANYAGHLINRMKYFSSLMFDAIDPCHCIEHQGILDTHADRRQLLSSSYVEIPGQELLTG